MSAGIDLVTELAIILIAAGVTTVISKALKQPLILGYIIAGFIVGPNLGLFPQFGLETVKDWSEIGIIFLLFSLGLEFSFKKLLKVGSSALIMACTICVGMFFVGIVVGNVIGWSTMESVFLGGLMSMSSTTVILKTYNDLGLKNKPYATLIFGSLVFEDLIAVLLMVLLSTMAVSNQFAGGEMVLALAKLAFFLILWFLVGIFLIPTLFRKAKKYLSDEILLVVSIGLCFGMVVMANAVGFSSALGAFVMGSILAETIEGEHIVKLTSSIKDLFGAIFFVSIGMLVDPVVIGEHWALILALTLVAMSGILFFATSGALLAGKGLDTAVHAGFSMAQLGEFSFIIAGVGCSLGVMRGFIYPVIITVSVITTFATPYMIKAADPVTAWIRRKLPQNILDHIDQPQSVEHTESKVEKSVWLTLIRSYLRRIGLYGVILVAILLMSKAWLVELVATVLPNSPDLVRSIICVFITLLVMTPFLYGMSVTNGSINAPARKLFQTSAANRWTIIALIVLRAMIAVVFVVAAITMHVKLSVGIILLIAFAAFALIMVSKFTLKHFTMFETRFMENLNAKETLERRNAPVATAFKDKLAGYDVHLRSVEVSPDFQYIGKTLREMPFRHSSGVNIVKIVRGSKGIEIPSGDVRIFPGDKLMAVGTLEQLDAFEKIMSENSVNIGEEEGKEKFDVRPVELTPESVLTGQLLKNSGMRAAGCLVVSVISDGQLITNPSPDYLFNVGDVVWIAGAESAIEWYK